MYIDIRIYVCAYLRTDSRTCIRIGVYMYIYLYTVCGMDLSALFDGRLWCILDSEP